MYNITNNIYIFVIYTIFIYRYNDTHIYIITFIYIDSYTYIIPRLCIGLHVD